MSASAKSAAGWEWSPPAGHESQPRIEWWFEQLAVVAVMKIGRRAHLRGDKQTFDRMKAISYAGRDAERSVNVSK